MRFEFELNWTVPRTQFKTLLLTALKFADLHRLDCVSIERNTDKDPHTFQVFTSKNPIYCEPRPTITAAYKAAEARIIGS